MIALLVAIIQGHSYIGQLYADPADCVDDAMGIYMQWQGDGLLAHRDLWCVVQSDKANPQGIHVSAAMARNDLASLKPVPLPWRNHPQAQWMPVIK